MRRALQASLLIPKRPNSPQPSGTCSSVVPVPLGRSAAQCLMGTHQTNWHRLNADLPHFRIDLDIEGGSTQYFTTFVNSLRSLMNSGSKQYFITGAPQCPFPDAYLGRFVYSLDKYAYHSLIHPQRYQCSRLRCYLCAILQQLLWPQ